MFCSSYSYKMTIVGLQYIRNTRCTCSVNRLHPSICTWFVFRI